MAHTGRARKGSMKIGHMHLDHSAWLLEAGESGPNWFVLSYAVIVVRALDATPVPCKRTMATHKV